MSDELDAIDLTDIGEMNAMIEANLPLVKHIVLQVAVHFPRHVEREELALGTPTCGTPAVPLHTGVAWPAVPGTSFGITATNAPPASAGLLVVGTPRAVAASLPLPFNGWLLVDSFANAFALSDAQGYARVDLTMPAGPAGPSCWGLSAQWFFLTNVACPGTGVLGNSERLVF